jgi:DNA-binding transcriptional MerR regulator
MMRWWTVSKGPDAFRTISEVAAELNLPQHVLRFWETRFGQIKPLKRGGGRRYYRPDDVDLLRGIRHLLYGEGYTIRGVQRILKEQGPRFAIAAGRGEAGPMVPSRPELDEDEDFADIRSGTNGNGNGNGRHFEEPALHVGELHPPPLHGNGSHNGKSGTVPPLTDDEVQRLETTLSELLELKRLLDQSR